MTDWKRVLLSCADGSVVPSQVVTAIVHQEVGVIDDETFHLVQIKAGELVHHEREQPNEDEWCLLSWTGDDVDAKFCGFVSGAAVRSAYSVGLFNNIKLRRETGIRAHYHPLNKTAH